MLTSAREFPSIIDLTYESPLRFCVTYSNLGIDFGFQRFLRLISARASLRKWTGWDIVLADIWVRGNARPRAEVRIAPPTPEFNGATGSLIEVIPSLNLDAKSREVLLKLLDRHRSAVIR